MNYDTSFINYAEIVTLSILQVQLGLLTIGSARQLTWMCVCVCFFRDLTQNQLAVLKEGSFIQLSMLRKLWV